MAVTIESLGHRDGFGGPRRSAIAGTGPRQRRFQVQARPGCASGVGRRLCLCGGEGGNQMDGQTGVKTNRAVPPNYEKPGDGHASANTLLAVYNNNIIINYNRMD